MHWKDVFNSAHGSWPHACIALEAAVKAGYPMISWNGLVFEINEDNKIYLEKPLCLAENLE